MQAVKSQNTGPEMIVRRMIHKMGYRFRLHAGNLPGKPDLVFPRLRKVIFVHGCFWHGHHCARGARVPRTNTAYWQSKIARNILRDAANLVALKSEDWRTAVIWECELKRLERVKKRIAGFLR